MGSIRHIVLKHIRTFLFLYIVVLIFFIAGISAGAFTVDALGEDQKGELVSYFQGFFNVLDKEPVYSGEVFRQSLVNNMQFVILIWFLGITVIGAVFILMIVGIKGFIIGFSVGFLAEEMGLRGFLFALAAILPQNLLIVPGIIAAGVMGIGFSWTLVRRRKSRHRKSFFNELLIYSLNMVVALITVFVGTCIEGYITPVFMKMFAF